MIQCGTCCECCKGPRELKLAKDYPHLKTYFKDGFYLSRADNGDCVYLDGNCTIYNERPDECKAFDCREHINNPNTPQRILIEARKRWHS